MDRDLFVCVLIGMFGCVLFMYSSMGFVVSSLDKIFWYGGGLGMFIGCIGIGFYNYKFKEVV